MGIHQVDWAFKSQSGKDAIHRVSDILSASCDESTTEFDES